MAHMTIEQLPTLDEARQAGTVIGLDDNWTGITDPKERRKRQNRLHQRTWRERQTARRESKASARLPGVHVIRIKKKETHQAYKSTQISSGLFTCSTRPSAPLVPRASRPSAVNTPGETPPTIRAHGSTSRGVDLPLLTSLPIRLGSPNPHIPPSVKDLHAFLRFNVTHAPISASMLSPAFPLSPDHRLITLVQYNVIRGMFTNVAILSLQDHIATDCGYNLNIAALPNKPTGRPVNFEPTQIQLTISHDIWIDTVPSPEFRDNLILNWGLYDADNLCEDMVGGLYEGFNDVEIRGIMLWGEPWAESGWEMSEDFVRKWGFLLKGCTIMMESTNQWRELRGEERLVLEI